MGIDSNEEYKYRPVSLWEKFCVTARGLVIKPVEWFRESVVEPNRPEYYWYHERMRRVPTVDECYEDDFVCMEEADEQFLRDRKVDTFIIHILKRRYTLCTKDHMEELHFCDAIREYLNDASTNFHIKYGDMQHNATALDCYMKQKHRMAWERRHGPIKSHKQDDSQKKTTTHD